MNLKHNVIIVFTLLLSIQLFAQTPLSINGRLKLNGKQLSSECGNPVQLRGVATHGLHWFPNCVTNNALDALAAPDWGVDVVRLTLYIDEGGYTTNPAGWRTKVDAYIAEVEKRGMYCIIDWHILTPGDPSVHTAEAIAFLIICLKHIKEEKVLCMKFAMNQMG